ncbi:uncharacterized protein LOC142336455 isoform X2 [Convolutriloba macropyga]|uniref:uncharacterized protein LOC142336455 isoform X2 n=1 Tax=Convolutriloba macropyga TaxID=536237 RepID=UPI003F5278C1
MPEKIRKLCLCAIGLVLNCGVVITVLFGRVSQRRNAAKVICSMCICNMFYLLFVMIVAVPMRSSVLGAADAMRSFCLMCHVAQVGSNAPKAVLTAHHLLIAQDTYWLIKRPFEYQSLSLIHFKQYFVLSWVVPCVFVIVFDSLTLCYYETLALVRTPPAALRLSMLPDLLNILVNFGLYSFVLGYIMNLYIQVFVEALGRIRRRSFPIDMRRVSLTSDSAVACLETYRQEMRLIRGFIVLVMGALMTACMRNIYYLLCFIIGCDNSCQSGGRLRDTLLSTFTACCLLLVTCLTPYAYFYRNPLFLKSFCLLMRDKFHIPIGRTTPRPPPIAMKSLEVTNS